MEILEQNQGGILMKIYRIFMVNSNPRFTSYSIFIEDPVEQFSAISYGDLIFAQKISLYLHRYVETSIPLATWNTLSNARVLELLPPLEKCLFGR
ncbi:hypothetical protein MTR_2g060580 [Medicago truncatula]|uniref:Uncharacterized protein n=1 Tax=Medicago truncatula TaxID=3880 RepID=G7IIY9_MEDTR|nr:hypothetical protein MTR_2g060580 [Medicago truncatula]